MCTRSRVLNRARTRRYAIFICPLLRRSLSFARSFAIAFGRDIRDGEILTNDLPARHGDYTEMLRFPRPRVEERGRRFARSRR